jgi:hypothetical protein
VAGSSQASAFICTITEGGKGRGPARAGSILQSAQPLLVKALLATYTPSGVWCKASWRSPCWKFPPRPIARSWRAPPPSEEMCERRPASAGWRAHPRWVGCGTDSGWASNKPFLLDYTTSTKTLPRKESASKKFGQGSLSWEVTSFTRVNLDVTTDLYYSRFALDERGVRHAPVPSELLAPELGTPAQGEDQISYLLLLSPVRRHGPRRTVSARRCWPVSRSPLSSEGSPGHEDAIVDQEAPYRVRRDVGLVGSVPQLLDIPLDLL